MSDLGSFFKDWLKKLFAREAWVGVALIVIASIALFVGMANFGEWWPACAAFAAIVSAGVLGKKFVEGRSADG